MKTIGWIMPAGLILAAVAFAAGPAVDTVEFAPFGSLHVYRTQPHPPRVVLFVSGDGGWNANAVTMAAQLATPDALLVGIDFVQWLKHLEGGPEGCLYPAADLEALSQFLQAKFGFPHYTLPVLVGYSAGATLVYAVLAQSPPNTFRGAISLGFCPDVEIPRPFCRGAGLSWSPQPGGKGYRVHPAQHLSEPWVVLQGEEDEVCDAARTRDFTRRVNTGRIVVLPRVGHGFASPHSWLPQFREEVARLTTTSRPDHRLPTGIADLPLVEVPSTTPASGPLAVIISGDGGWAGLDREVAGVLAAKGIPVVGLNSLSYFWTPKPPEQASADLGRILRAYLEKWAKQKAVLIGYSRGADVLPFMAARLPADLLGRLELIALLGPSHEVEFEFHLSDWIGGRSSRAIPTLPEVRRLTQINLLCVRGTQEADSLCDDLTGPRVRIKTFAGAHHFGGDYRSIAQAILEALPAAAPPPTR